MCSISSAEMAWFVYNTPCMSSCPALALGQGGCDKAKNSAKLAEWWKKSHKASLEPILVLSYHLSVYLCIYCFPAPFDIFLNCCFSFDSKKLPPKVFLELLCSFTKKRQIVSNKFSSKSAYVVLLNILPVIFLLSIC